MNSEVSVQHSDCLRTINNIGGQIVKNICTGAETAVPWGTADWAFAALLGGILVGLLIMLIVVVINIAMDAY